jgi:hypothetical protein
VGGGLIYNKKRKFIIKEVEHMENMSLNHKNVNLEGYNPSGI